MRLPQTPIPPDFSTWTYNNLVRFAAEANLELYKNKEEIKQLKETLANIKAALLTLTLVVTHHTGGKHDA